MIPCGFWYHQYTSAKMGHKLLAIVDKHFLKDHKLRKTLQPKQHQNQLGLREQHETNNRQPSQTYPICIYTD